MKKIKIVSEDLQLEVDIKAEDWTDAVWLAGMVIFNLRFKLHVRPQVTEVVKIDE